METRTVSRLGSPKRATTPMSFLIFIDFTRLCETLKLGFLRFFRYPTIYQLQSGFNEGKSKIFCISKLKLAKPPFLHSLIVESLGFTRFQVTLLGTLDGAIESVSNSDISSFPLLITHLYCSYYHLHGRQVG